MPRVTTVVIRHPKERLSKCSLVPLHGRSDMIFYKATKGFRFDATSYILLTLGAPVLSAADGKGCPRLLLLDGTWRYAGQLEKYLDGDPIRRSLPKNICTTYPRASKLFEDPETGLASVEALYAARRILGDDDPTLLEGYRWKDEFLKNFNDPAETRFNKSASAITESYS